MTVLFSLLGSIACCNEGISLSLVKSKPMLCDFYWMRSCYPLSRESMKLCTLFLSTLKRETIWADWYNKEREEEEGEVEGGIIIKKWSFN
jgi:hypothetical protein